MKPKPVREDLKQKWLGDGVNPWMASIAVAARTMRLRKLSERAVSVTVGILVGGLSLSVAWQIAAALLGVSVLASLVLVAVTIKSKVEEIELQSLATSGIKRVNRDEEVQNTAGAE